MINFIPIFPLSIVVYPGEQLNLHIFEPRYKQLIKECFAGKKPFGIPVIIENKLQEMGTLMQVVEISKEYDDGKMDIRTEGIKVFRILELIKSLPDKLYSGAIVNYPDNIDNGSSMLRQKLLTGMRELHKFLLVEKSFAKPDNELGAYDIAHHTGLSLAEEYEVLELLQELQRQEYLKRHFKKALPAHAEMEALKERVKMNGHFKNLGGGEW